MAVCCAGCEESALCVCVHLAQRRFARFVCSLAVSCSHTNMAAADGRKQQVLFDKITARVVKLSYGLNQEHVDPVSLCWRWSEVFSRAFHICVSLSALLLPGF